TCHSLGDDAGPDAWHAWWDKNRGRTREDLMEEALRASKQDLKKLAGQVVAQILDGIGDSTSRQVAALSDSHPEGRREGAEGRSRRGCGSGPATRPPRTRRCPCGCAGWATRARRRTPATRPTPAPRPIPSCAPRW